MRKLWHDEAWEEYLYWQSQDKKTLKKINRLLTDIDRNGYQCTGKPEPLGENLAGYWSVRIDEKNRIVFQIIDGNDLEILQCGSHYKDKYSLPRSANIKADLGKRFIKVRATNISYFSLRLNLYPFFSELSHLHSSSASQRHSIHRYINFL